MLVVVGIGGKSASSRDLHRARVARYTIPLYSRRTMRGRLRVEPTSPESIAHFRPFALCRYNVIPPGASPVVTAVRSFVAAFDWAIT